MFKIRLINNPPTVEDMKMLYQSEMYQDLLKEFDKRSRHKLDSRPDDDVQMHRMFTYLQRHYLVLNIPFEQVLSEFEQQKEQLLNFTMLSIDYFVKLEEDEFSDEGEKIGVGRTFMMDKFCEIHLLGLKDNERLLHYLETTKMPDSKRYMDLILNLYSQALSSHE